MFSGGGKRRPIASYNRPPPTVPVKSTTTTATATTPSSSVATRLGPPVVSKQQQPPPSSSSPNKATQNKFTTTTTKVVVKKVIQPAPVVAPPRSNGGGGGPRSVNKYRPPTPPPAPPAPEPTPSRKGKGKQRYDDDEEDDHVQRAGGSPPKKRARRPSPPSSTVGARPARADSSSDLDPLTPSEEEEDESDLSSADEEWASKIFRREEGAPVAVRDVAYTPGSEEGGEGTSEAAAASLTSAESLVLQNPTAYRSHFIDPANPDRPVADWAGNDIPTIELEYPGDGGRERFALLAPRSDDEYNPIEDVMAVILIVLDHFLTPDQASHHFGHAPGKTAFAAFLYNRTGSSSASNSRAGTPSSGPAGAKEGESGANGEGATAAAAAAANGESASALPDGQTNGFRIEPSDSSEPLIRQLEKARSKADGPAFLAALTRYNLTLSHLKHLGVVRANIATMKGLREKVWTRVFTQCYDRAVGPTLEDVKKYRAFSDNVYGELLPKFMNEIFAKTHLGPNSVFVDLGSGVGNCVVQAALATGAESWGFENMPHASLLARAQVVEANERFKLWGLSGGEMQVREADFCEDPEVGAVLRRADVVLVNNEVFTSALNERLSWLFLELPPGAKIVSLKPFLPPSFKLSSHNAGSPLAILSQYPPARYTHNCVSWKPEGGTYFVARIDRTRLMRFQDKERERERKRERQQRERRERREGSSAAGSSSGMSRTGSTASNATPSAGTPHGMSRTASRQGSNLAR